MKLRHILTVTLLAITACTTAPAEAIIATEDGCAVHNPNPKSGESFTGSGDCRDGFAHEPGTIAWFRNGAPNGRYEGMVVNGRIQGEGTAHYPSGTHYTGRFRAGQPDGPGTLYFPDGRRYERLWLAARPDGEGVMFLASGRATPQRWEAGRRLN